MCTGGTGEEMMRWQDGKESSEERKTNVRQTKG